jgi:hypothetical protein
LRWRRYVRVAPPPPPSKLKETRNRRIHSFPRCYEQFPVGIWRRVAMAAPAPASAPPAAAGGAGAAGEAKPDAGPWLHAWYDPVAGVKTFSQCVRGLGRELQVAVDTAPIAPHPPPATRRCMRLADLAGDGDYRLIVVDQDKRMKVYKGA